ncbi:3-beta hydroxysteroid dehydrogenase [Mycobacterium intermedium]|uniref:3-beta hydroxysteroid dehydrogenase n=1 Tax=Mycobacterium intermedium TaxID=28445 RepID=A0A1E3SJ66_MYCIE|nr:SDR family oxidoreductase [Mycobacterium intermedium]MCV6963796.1 SDR family oxidoreductase [Mycobacterium intermedium]ODR02224.1 3-beta hydroxysteroid dehydrogenase [Mycobacterium intermedium]OPE52617.1 3-beta hydroxysteroid dehydrogenase [Mycobacterium intermedium]ORB10148.1 3-beta hydroxysteroid dehydrogenase [Mycobacterium intermedium]
MHVFVTGATGHIGAVVVSELHAAGHQVTGLARSDDSAAALEAAGVTALRGDLEDLDGLAAAAAASDGVIHLAFRHDFADWEGAAQTDLRAVNAMGEALIGSDRPFVITSGTLMLAFRGEGGFATEDETLPNGPRIDSENAAIALAERGVRSAVVRLAPLVHSDLDHHGFAHHLIGVARDTGVSAYIGDGFNRWPAVHTLDAAHLFCLAVEKAPAGTILHGVADEGVPFRDIAGVIGRHVGVPVVSIPLERADHFGFLGPFASADNPTSNALTRKQFDWDPQGPGLIEDLDAGHYFK